jgi:endonuclease/exonuclease/phosphatase family metal-dependent hydrolase
LKGWGAACPRVCSYLILRDRSTGRKFCFANTHTDHVSALAREKGMLLVIERMKEFGAGVPIVFTGDHNCREDEAPAKAVAGILKDALYLSENPQRGSWRTFSGWKWKDSEMPIVEALKVPVEMRNAKKGSPDGIKIASGVHPYEQYGARIDYIYVSPDVRVVDFETVNDPRPGKKLYPSDHFPVVATIEFPQD